MPSRLNIKPVKEVGISESNYIGKRFGTRVCIADEKTQAGRVLTVRCDCGLEITQSAYRVKTRGCRSCAKKKHGHRPKGSASPEYRSWRHMTDRCNNESHHAFKHYGGRGIEVCERWRKFENFLEDMGRRPPGTSLDRIDNELGYCKENCRWATPLEQGRNKRSSIFIEKNGEVRCLSEWMELLLIPASLVASTRKNGWPREMWIEPRGARYNGASSKGVMQ